MHDLINGRPPHTVIDYCSFLEHPYQTRNKEKRNLKVETVHTNIAKQSISYSGSFNWTVDYKILTKCLANRLKRCMQPLIHSDQSGFVKGKNN